MGGGGGGGEENPKRDPKGVLLLSIHTLHGRTEKQKKALCHSRLRRNVQYDDWRVPTLLTGVSHGKKGTDLENVIMEPRKKEINISQNEGEKRSVKVGKEGEMQVRFVVCWREKTEFKV